MNDLHGWITQQIDRVEAVARATQQSSLGWEYDDFVHEIRDLGNGGTVANVYQDGTGAHIALNDPAAVLRRCASDRKILKRHRPTGCRGFGCDCTSKCPTCDWTESQEQGQEPPWGYPDPHVFPCPTIRDLAEGYGCTGDTDPSKEQS